MVYLRHIPGQLPALQGEGAARSQSVAWFFSWGGSPGAAPVEILHGHVVQCWNLYPQVRDLWNLGFPSLTVLEALAQVWAVGALRVFWWGWRPRSGAAPNPVEGLPLGE